MNYPRIVEEFIELAELEVHVRRERAIADVVTAKLKALGFKVEEDKAGEIIGGNTGNLIATLPGSLPAPPIMFSAHLDRVENHGSIRPQVFLEEDVIRSDGTSILAADDLSGICAILEGVRQIQEEKAAHGDIEVIFSVAEEVGLLGARNLDYSRIKSQMAYVIDTGGPLGTIINQAPTQYTFIIKVHGRSAHAGMEPEKGLSAIRVAATALTRLREGRLSPSSTANYGIIRAGKATNIVCDYAEIHGECRSTDPREVSGYIEEMKQILSVVAAEFQTSIETELNLEYNCFKVEHDEPVVRIAVEAMRNIGLEADIHPGGGGLDGNFFNENGIKTIGISPGYVGVHTSKEEQPISQLLKCAKLVAEIIKEAAKRS